MSNSSLSVNPTPPPHDAEVSVMKKDDDDATPQLLESSLAASRSPAPLPALPPPPIVAQMMNPAVAPPSPSCSNLVGRANHTAALASLVTASRGSDRDVTRLRRPSVTRMRETLSFSSALSDLPVVPAIPVPDNAVSSVTPPPLASSQQNASPSVDLGALPVTGSETCPPVHSPPSSPVVPSASPLAEDTSPTLTPPLEAAALSLPALPPPPALPPTSTHTDDAAPVKIPLYPSHPTAAALATPSCVEGVRSMDTTTSAAPANLPHAVTSLLPVPSAPAVVVPASPLRPPSASVTPASLVDTPALAAAVTTMPSPVTNSRPQYLHSQRRTLEAAARDLLSARNEPKDLVICCTSTSSCGGSSDRSSTGGDSGCVRRTTRISQTRARGRRRQRRGGAHAKAAAKPVSSRRRRKTHSSHGALPKVQRPPAARLFEGEGQRGPWLSSALREKTSMPSQSTTTRAPYGDTKRRKKGRGDRTSRGCGNTVATDAAGMDGAAPAASAGGGASPTVGDGSDAPLLFTSPAARLHAAYQNSTKNKGLTKAEAIRLTQRSFLGSTDAGRRHKTNRSSDVIAADDGDDTGGTGGVGTELAVQFRATGAFNDEDEWARPWHTGSSDVRSCQRGGSAESTTSSKLAADNASDEHGVVLVLTIRGMSPLHADAGVVHPLVRAWVVSCATGRSLVQASTSVPCAVTHPFDLRAHKTRAPWWNAQLALRLSAEQMRTAAEDAMLLLEVLDFGNETIHGFPLMREGLYPICWGFLMLRGCAGRSNLLAADDLHVQLYRYPSRTPWYLSLLSALIPVSWSTAGAAFEPHDASAARFCSSGPRSSIANDVPTIYTVFANANTRKIPYEGCIVLRVRQTSNTAFVPDTTEMLLYEEYLLSMLAADGGSGSVPRSSRYACAAANDEVSLGRMREEDCVRGAAIPASPWSTIVLTENYYRMDGERSLLPHEILQTTAVLGVVTCVSFAHSGSFVALGVCRHLQHVVELRNPLLPEMAVVACLVGHTGHVHRVVFQKEDKYLLSCSSDGTVRVWQPRSSDGVLTPEPSAGPESMQCVCTLPHGFPVYTAVFHQGKIIAGGFSDQLFVWDYEHTIQGEMESMMTTGNTTLRSITTFTPAHLTRAPPTHSPRSTLAVLGQLVQRVDTAGAAAARECTPTMTLSLASNERSNRVWSVHANGSVVCWRATTETASHGGGDSLWQMSTRHTADCSGAAEVQVKGGYAIVTCGCAPVVFVFDATTCEQLRVVNTRLSVATPIHLLPDGEAFVAAMGGPGRLLAWECFDGGLCTAASGYGKASPLFNVARMAWAESQQLAVFVSRSPSSEGEMARYTQGPMQPAAGESAAAFHYRQQEQQYRQSDIPTEATLITIAGTVRRKSTVLLKTDPHSSDAFVTMFGGDLSALFAAPVATSIPYDATEKGARMNAIVNFWRGLVSQHRRTEARPQDSERVSSSTDAFGTHPAAWRALQYIEDVADAL
ncbi:WD domain, G-beta repeat family protein [Leishmania donovani]|uniref:WD domain, G-beta repeat family protein n=1 Tax=Leishmania donovani TaxID=5661 RepID=A0A504XBM4_LEIDO|nr:WD domain, G-beta repeat family protein [Leishmania donovani]